MQLPQNLLLRVFAKKFKKKSEWLEQRIRVMDLKEKKPNSWWKQVFLICKLVFSLDSHKML